MNGQDSADHLWDIGQVAKRLNVSTRHVATLHKRGLIPQAIRVGRCCRWDPRLIDEFIRTGGRVGCLAAPPGGAICN
jgi:predicted DNA-binding transcriptional regulator AlpA